MKKKKFLEAKKVISPQEKILKKIIKVKRVKIFLLVLVALSLLLRFIFSDKDIVWSKTFTMDGTWVLIVFLFIITAVFMLLDKWLDYLEYKLSFYLPVTLEKRPLSLGLRKHKTIKTRDRFSR